MSAWLLAETDGVLIEARRNAVDDGRAKKLSAGDVLVESSNR